MTLRYSGRETMTRLHLLPLALAALLTPVTLARAEILGGVGAEPVKLQADQLDIDILAGEATLTGKVTLTKGDLVVNCPRIDLRFEHAPHLTWARGSGGVTADVRTVDSAQYTKFAAGLAQKMAGKAEPKADDKK